MSDDDIYTSVPNAVSRGSGLLRGLKRLLVLCVVTALAGALLYTLSALNHRTYSVEEREGQLWVMRGRFLPYGESPFVPEDKSLAEAYAPLRLSGDSAGALLLRRYDERDQLDRDLFELLSGWAGSRVRGDEPRVLEEGLYYLSRAEKLSGISDAQREKLRQLQGEVAFFEARHGLDNSLKGLKEAIRKLHLAADTGSRHAREALVLLDLVEGPATQLGRVAQGLVSAPAAEPAPILAPSAVPPPAAPSGAPAAKPPEAAPSTPAAEPAKAPAR